MKRRNDLSRGSGGPAYLRRSQRTLITIIPSLKICLPTRATTDIRPPTEDKAPLTSRTINEVPHPRHRRMWNTRQRALPPPQRLAFAVPPPQRTAHQPLPIRLKPLPPVLTPRPLLLRPNPKHGAETRDGDDDDGDGRFKLPQEEDPLQADVVGGE